MRALAIWFSLCMISTFTFICDAKPYVNKKFPLRDKEFGDNPFAPADYSIEDNGVYPLKTKPNWLSWNPPQHHGEEQDNDDKKDYSKEKEAEKKEPEEERSMEDVEDDFKDKDKLVDDLDKPKVKVDNNKNELNLKADFDDDYPKFEDPCKNIYCHYGRVCKTKEDGNGECVCADADFCKSHKKEVCGTDGVVYESHCELHRMACVKQLHIGIDHSHKSCQQQQQQQQQQQPLQAKDNTVEDDKSKKPFVDPDSDKSLITVEKESLVKKEKKNKKLIKALSKKKELKDQDKAASEKDEAAKDVEVVPVVTPTPSPCTDLEYEHLKNNLVQYHCARIGENECSQQDGERRQFVADTMFNYYDRDGDQHLTEAEFEDIENRDHLEKLSRFCRLVDMLTFDDTEEDGNISLAEFYTAFRVPTVLLDDDLKVFASRVMIGNSVELKCDIKGPGATKIVWQRNGAGLDEITSDEIKVFEDGSLYIGNLGLHHMANYTCQDKMNPQVVQTHVLKVQMPPAVKVSPSTQFHMTGASVTLKCHADGVPEPDIVWEMNETPLPDDPTGDHYLMLHNNATLEIRRATYTRDTGAYKCKAHNSAGTSQDIATVFIENTNVPKYSDSFERYEVFVVFHDTGYTIYEPNHCHIEHQVSGSFGGFKLLPEYGDTLHTMCDVHKGCLWGAAVNVRNQFIYVTQPHLNRVVVIEIRDRSNPVEVIPTDKVPVKIQYVEHLDQVWVVCWNQEEDTGSKTAIVIRQASEDVKHHTVHTQPVGNRFDLIEDLFLPPSNNLGHHFQYGYVVHNHQQGLYKLDLAAMEYVKNIDLTQYKCVPKSAAFLALGGKVIVHCVAAPGEPAKSSRLVLDYVTDKVLQHSQLGGEPHMSPDGRYLVTVEDDGNTISVSRMHDDGQLEHIFDEYTNLHISDVTFFPSERGRGYDFYASSANKNDVLYINLASGKVEMIEGVGQALDKTEWPWNKHNRVIVSGGIFGEYLMTPSKDSVVVIDGKRRHVQCEWQNIAHGSIIVWVEPLHL